MAESEAVQQQNQRDNPGGAPPARVSSSGAEHLVVKRSLKARLASKPHIWFLLPALIVYGLLFVYPTIWAFKLSLFDWRGGTDIGSLNSLLSPAGVWHLITDWSGVPGLWGFVGLENFSELLRSPRFRNASLNSAKLFLFIFVFQNTVSLALALLLNRRSRMTHVYRAIIFLPVIMSAVATGIIWVLMLDPLIGASIPSCAISGSRACNMSGRPIRNMRC